ncbi:MAG: hypothetical protein ACI4XL_09200 [Bacillus sp. (in: firmicutes)]
MKKYMYTLLESEAAFMKEKPNIDEARQSHAEETAAEFADFPSVRYDRHRLIRQNRNSARVIGIVALVLSILAILGMPFLLGSAGIIIGFIALRNEEITLGSWAISIGSLSLILGVLMRPLLLSV